MRNPTKTLFGKTWAGWLNILLLQWCCARLGYGCEWAIIFPIVPLTGWRTDYIPKRYRAFRLGKATE